MEKKWNLQDIKPAGQKRSPKISRSQPTEPGSDNTAPTPSPRSMRIPLGSSGKKKSKTVVMTVLGLLILLVIVFGAGSLLGGTEITVKPRHREPNINATFTAYRTPQVGELSYEIMELEAEGERQVNATGEESVTEQAVGEITIYNKTTATERLIKNTRFESPDGLIFHIAESAVVPAGKKSAGGEIVPGTVKAKVFADKAGEEYNLAPTKFTIPGYRENGFSELYENLYAESQTSFTGGFDGLRFIINEPELSDAKESLHAELAEALRSRVDTERPAGFVVFDEAITFTYETLPSVEAGENMATIKERAVLRLPMFEETEFAAYLAAASIPGYEQEPVRIEDAGVLSFNYVGTSTKNSNIAGLESLEFKLSGKPMIVWTYDTESLKNDLAGAPKTALTSVLGGYPAIEKAEAVVRPFWRRSFSDNASSIKIVESLGD